MFRKDLEQRLCKIFGFEKTTYNAPSDSFEQDVLFIEIGDCKSRVSQGKIFARIRGEIIVFSQDNKLTYGFFNKRIEQADLDLKAPLFFHDIDTNVETSPARLQNINERRCGFQFFYSGQYNPVKENITSENLTFTETEGA